MTNKHKLKIHSLLRVSVKKIVEQTTISRLLVDNLKITFQHCEPNNIIVFLNNKLTPVSFPVSERIILGRLRNGGHIPWDKSSDYYAVAPDGTRCKFLYVYSGEGIRVGCRTEFIHTYQSSCDCRRPKRIAVIKSPVTD